MLLFLELVAQLPHVACAPIRPLRRKTALRVLSKLVAEDAGGVAISMDIGGTLAKVMLFQPRAAPPPDGEKPRLELGDAYLDAALAQSGERELSMYVPALKGNLHFFVFESRHVAAAMALVKCRPAWRRQFVLRATGGGSYKHASELQRADGHVLDDDASIVTGLNFLLHHTSEECFQVRVQDYSPLTAPAAYRQFVRNYCAVASPPDEYLYCSVGHGVSILEVRGGRADGVTRYCKRGYSCIGGSTFWGLVCLLTSCSTFDEVIRLTESGSSSRVDMLVGDIYGGDCPAMGLGGDVIAASMGKVAMQRAETRALGPKFLLRYLGALLRHWEECFWLVVLAVVNSVPGTLMSWLSTLAAERAASAAMSGSLFYGARCHAHDVALSLLRMVSNNIGHIACLHAQQHGLKQIVFGGSFLRDHPYTIATISSAVHFFGRGEVEAVFLQHDGFVGAIGAHLTGTAVGGHVERVAGDYDGRMSLHPVAVPPVQTAKTETRDQKSP